MKLGLVTDIHERDDLLSDALQQFQRERVDEVVVIGDVFRMGQRLAETCALLKEVNAVGVWGNHDFGLCTAADDEDRTRYGDVAVEFMSSLQPRLVVDECHFCHVEPWLDPNDWADLWFFGGPPDQPDRLERIFNAVAQRLIFCGHFHKWQHATPRGVQDWQGQSRLNLAKGQHFVVIGALCEGRFAVLDQEAWLLKPFNL